MIKRKLSARLGLTRLAILLLAALTAAGCAVDRSGGGFSMSLDRDQFTAQILQRVQVSEREVVLRRTRDGRYQIKFMSRLQVLDLGKDEVLAIEESHVFDGHELLALRMKREGCDYAYKVVDVTPEGASIWDLPNCADKLEFGFDGKAWVARQAKASGARYWVFRDGRMFEGQEPVAKPPPKPKPKPAPQRRRPRRAAPAPAPVVEPAPPPVIDLRAPSSIDISRDPERVPVKVILQDEP